jgi:hypothetical protein
MELQRSSGIVLHPTSLPGGTLGAEAYAFVDWLAAAGQSGGVLPLSSRGRSPTHPLVRVRCLNGFGTAIPVRAVPAVRRANATGSQTGARGGRWPTTVRPRMVGAVTRAHGIGLIGDVPTTSRSDSVAEPSGNFLGGAAHRGRSARSGSTGAVRSSTGMCWRRRATAGGSSGCGGRSRCTTSPGSITSAASPPSGRSRRARTISTPAAATGSPAPASRSSGRRRPSSASCP